ncbi:MAG: hypothetical protein J5634_02745 [Bacilli bacterium]|nr:hypothetical protein [Bacilli bacterium]
MKITLILIYLLGIITINFLQIKDIKNVNNDILFDNLSLNTLFISLLIFYFKYKSISLSLLMIFIMIFINFLYIKDIKSKLQKTMLTWFFIINIITFIYGTLKYFFI